MCLSLGLIRNYLYYFKAYFHKWCHLSCNAMVALCNYNYMYKLYFTHYIFRALLAVSYIVCK